MSGVNVPAKLKGNQNWSRALAPAPLRLDWLPQTKHSFLDASTGKIKRYENVKKFWKQCLRSLERFSCLSRCPDCRLGTTPAGRQHTLRLSQDQFLPLCTHPLPYSCCPIFLATMIRLPGVRGVEWRSCQLVPATRTRYPSRRRTDSATILVQHTVFLTSEVKIMTGERFEVEVVSHGTQSALEMAASSASNQIWPPLIA
jgi:hypothetical protein